MSITCGRKGTLIDFAPWTAKCRAVLGYVPNMYAPLKHHELKALGFKEAAKALEETQRFAFRVKRYGAPRRVA